ncbi:MAG: TM2 domain-containing protein [Anderseniella sp.]
MLGGNGDDEFDIDLSHLQPYGHGKSVTMLVLCWLFTGTLGGHRFYLGHWFIASAMLSLGVTGFFLIRIHFAQMIQSLQPNATAEPSATLWYLLLVLGVVQGIWWLVDGIYVIWRMLSAKVNG